MAEQEKFFFFWDGIFSQWHSCKFTVGGIVYNCAEQYMMAQKARMFGDDNALERIMATSSARQQKAIGREVKGFVEEEWNKVAKQIVFVGNVAKFTQNKAMLDFMVSTEGQIIVEASPYDRIWGIGLGEEDPDRFDRSKWRGTNWLGEVLMRVRDAVKPLPFMYMKEPVYNPELAKKITEEGQRIVGDLLNSFNPSEHEQTK